MANFDYLAPLSANHDLSWYLDPKNIPNQALPNDTIAFFHKGPRVGYMPPLVFLNFLQQQFDYVHVHMNDGPSIVEYFKGLPIDKDLLHILLAHLLKWYGGYPVNYMLAEQQATMKAIEKFFLAYPGDTPEKVFAKADMDFRHYLQKLEIAFNTSFQHGIPVEEILKAMPSHKKVDEHFASFDALFEAAKLYRAIGPFSKVHQEITTKAAINLGFNMWLTEFKGWEYRDEEGYTELLTKSNLLAYLRYRDEQEQLLRNEYASNADSWNYRKQPHSNDITLPPPGDEDDRQDVDEKLQHAKDAFKTDSDYIQALHHIIAYLHYQQLPKQVIVVKNKCKKRLAFALGEIHRHFHPQTTIDRNYLIFYTKTFSAFEKDKINENVFADKLYKYSISMT
jgi:hypothetical protein